MSDFTYQPDPGGLRVRTQRSWVQPVNEWDKLRPNVRVQIVGGMFVGMVGYVDSVGDDGVAVRENEAR